MKLVVAELTGSGLEQGITPMRNTIVAAIRPHIYRHNFATGSLKLQILDAGLSVIAESAAVSISSIGSMAYFHGYVRFDIDAVLKKGQSYTVKLLSQGGYTFSESAYCGWVNGLDLGKYPTDTPPLGSYNYPFDYEIWERTAK